jgi:hypothetical protein
LQRYESQVALPWDHKLAGAQRVWFVVHDNTDQRRVRFRVSDFEMRTRQAGHGWRLHDFSDTLAHWMAGHKYRDSYFEEPELLDSALGKFFEDTVAELRAVLTHEAVDQNTVVAVAGIESLFGFLRVSDLVRAVEHDIRGRLLVFFPGEHEANNYRLLDARDGWNYLAVAITAYQGGSPE